MAPKVYNLLELSQTLERWATSRNVRPRVEPCAVSSAAVGSPFTSPTVVPSPSGLLLEPHYTPENYYVTVNFGALLGPIGRWPPSTFHEARHLLSFYLPIPERAHGPSRIQYQAVRVDALKRHISDHIWNTYSIWIGSRDMKVHHAEGNQITYDTFLHTFLAAAVQRDQLHVCLTEHNAIHLPVGNDATWYLDRAVPRTMLFIKPSL